MKARSRAPNTSPLPTDGSGRQNVTLMVQVPASFDPKKPCIITRHGIRLARCVRRHQRRADGASSAARWPIPTKQGTGGHARPGQRHAPLIDGTRTASAAGQERSLQRMAVGQRAWRPSTWIRPTACLKARPPPGQNAEKDWGQSTCGRSVRLLRAQRAFWRADTASACARSSRPTPSPLRPPTAVAQLIAAGSRTARPHQRRRVSGARAGTASRSVPASRLPGRQHRTVCGGQAAAGFHHQANLYQPCAAGAVGRGQALRRGLAAGFYATI